MAVIPANQARPLFTQGYIGRFSDTVVVPGFLRSFFPSVVKGTRYLEFDVTRNSEKIAVDVARGSDGNRNRVSLATNKIVDPGYYKEWFDVTEMDVYWRIFGNGSVDAVDVSAMIDHIVENQRLCRAKIERAYEKQCADVLQTGVVQLKDGGNVSYRRLPASLIDNSGTPWSTGTTDIKAQLEAGANFLRQRGKMQSGIVNVILGSDAFSAMMNNAKFIASNNIFNIKLDSIRAPQREAQGGILHGEISLNSYMARIWTYNEYYQNDAGNMVPYIDPKKVIMLPENPTGFRMGFAAVPQLIDLQNPTLKVGEFIYDDYVDPKRKTHEFSVESAGIPIPGLVDQMWTAGVLA